nr:MAG TPA: hypothetical protein [Caudoviricetes sp.]
MLFEGPIFAQSWFDDYSPNIMTKASDDNVYTFN